MLLKNKLKYIKSHFFKKQNNFFMVIISFLIFVSFACLTMINFVIEYKNENINKNLQARTLLVYTSEEGISYNKINDLNHVIFNDSSIYLNGHFSRVKELDVADKNANVLFLPLTDSSVIKKDYILNDGETICSQKFYPYNLYVEKDNKVSETLDYEDILNSTNLIGNDLTIISDNKLNKDIFVKIKDSFDATESLNSMNTCYITQSDFIKVKSPYKMMGSGVDIDGNEITDYYEYDDNIVIVDNYKNVDYVERELNKIGFNVVRVFNFDNDMMQYYILIPIFISIIIFIICFNLMYSFLNKKSKHRLANYGILKSCGYENKLIINLEIIENILSLILCFVISFTIYYGALTFISKMYFKELFYENMLISIPYAFIMMEFVILAIIISLVSKKIMNRTLLKSANKLLRNE